MSSDEEMAVIGKLVVEQKDLARRNAALHSEIHRIGKGLERLGRDLTSGTYMFSFHRLTPEETALLDIETLTTLLREKEAIAKRHEEVRSLLKEAGISN
jgi:two-component SAPR family response regulator